MREPYSKALIICVIVLWVTASGLSAQIKAKAISYQVSIELGYYDPLYYYQTDADPCTIEMETDLYYTKEQVKTVSRIVEKPEDFRFLPLDVSYALKSNDQFFIDESSKQIYNIKNISYLAEASVNEKTILGYKCKAYEFTDFQNVRVLAYVATKLPANISPWGNVKLKGTVLEIITSTGYHIQATEFAEGEVPAGFFELPAYQVKTITLSQRP